MPPLSTSEGSILILSSHLYMGFLSGLFPSGFPTKTLYTPLLSPYRSSHSPFYHPNNVHKQLSDITADNMAKFVRSALYTPFMQIYAFPLLLLLLLLFFNKIGAFTLK